MLRRATDSDLEAAFKDTVNLKRESNYSCAFIGLISGAKFYLP